MTTSEPRRPLADTFLPPATRRGEPFALTAVDLRSIADALDKLSRSGVRVDSAIVGGHRIQVQWHESRDQRDGPWYTVTAIERAEARR